MQIDLLIDRADNVVNICEMKYAPEGYAMTAASLKSLKTKIGVLRQYISPRKYISTVMVTSNGVIRNQHSSEIPEFVNADQLFEP